MSLLSLEPAKISYSIAKFLQSIALPKEKEREKDDERRKSNAEKRGILGPNSIEMFWLEKSL